MKTLRTAFLDFWPGFEPAHFLERFPELAEVATIELVGDPAQADLVVFSCFIEGHKTLAPRDPRAWTATKGVRLFYTAENLPPDFETCDFAMSFRRELVDARHMRVPNYVGTQRAFGFGSDALLHPPDPTAARHEKKHFCAYVQGNQVPFREEFVRKLSEYRRVECAGPSLNNTGHVVDRRGKYALYRECKFAITFENEATVGYTSEKLPDALLSACVPIYWGDPTVHLDFHPGSFVHFRPGESLQAVIERVIELDRDDEQYEAILGASRYPTPALTEWSDPRNLRAFFTRVTAQA